LAASSFLLQEFENVFALGEDFLDFGNASRIHVSSDLEPMPA
jgi:hypothetical protein